MSSNLEIRFYVYARTIDLLPWFHFATMINDLLRDLY